MHSLRAGEKAPWARITLVWLAICALTLLINAKNLAAWQFPDPDDALRLVQLRDLIAGQGWFDLHQYRINPGNSPVMHWSRLVDIPLALIVGLFTPLLGSGLAEKLAVVLIPLITLGAIMAVVGTMAFRLFNKEIAGLACLACGLSSVLLAQVKPMRIDHHGWQIFAIVLALAALMHPRARIGGAVAGASLGLGLSISLEVLPLTVAFGLVLALRGLTDRAQLWWLPSCLWGLATSQAAIFALTRGFADLSQYCDVVSPAHIGAFFLLALGSTAMAALVARRPAFGAAVWVGGLGLVGLVSGAVFLSVAPHCAAGPFANLDPLVREYWYANVFEGRPAWMQQVDPVIPTIIQGLIGLGSIAWLWRASTGALRLWWLEYGLILATALIAGILVWRSMAFVGALSAVPFGWLTWRLLRAFRTAEKPLSKIGLAVLAMVVLLPASPYALAKMALPNKAAPAHGGGQTAAAVRISSCELRKYAPLLNQFAGATIFAPIDVGPSLLERTHHRVIATGHHRANMGMRDVIAAFTATPDQAHGIVKRHKAQFLMLCADLAEPRLYAQGAPNGLASQILSGQTPSWLEEVALDAPESFRVWKVL